MSWQTPPAILEGEDELQLKLEYARIVARNERERFTAGYKIFPGPDNYGRALQAQYWYDDPIVQDEITRLRYNDSDDDPDAELEAEIHQRARSAEDKDALGYYKLLAEMRGKTGRGSQTNIQINNNDNRVVKVLRVPARDITPEDDQDFEDRFYAQQTKLIADARSSRPVAA